MRYCGVNAIDPYQGRPADVLSFLTALYQQGAAYGTLNSTRSALALLVDFDLAADKSIARFFKGVFRLRPPLPRYEDIWDAEIALQVLDSWWPLEELPLRKLSYRVLLLLALSSAQRVQSFHLITVDNIRRTDSETLIAIPDLVKQSRPGKPQPLIRLPVFRSAPERCVATTLDAYIAATEPLRPPNCPHLFITTQRPFHRASANTLRRWISCALRECGVEDRFTAHSTRHAATSAAHRRGVDVSTILQTAGWSGTSTFAKHYLRPVRPSPFAEAVLLRHD